MSVWPQNCLKEYEPEWWASHASTSLDLLICGYKLDEPIALGIKDGLRVCEVFIQGDEVRRSTTFSQVRLEAQTAVERVERFGGHRFVVDAAEVKEKLAAVLAGGALDGCAALRDFFFQLVELYVRNALPSRGCF